MSETPVTVPFVSFRPMERELDADLRGAFARVLDNSWYIGGREDAAFEKAFADYCGVRHCVGCGNVATDNQPASPETEIHCDDRGCRHLEGRCCCADHVSIDECSCGPECATRAPRETAE